jgi:hypothetical protein
MNQNHYLMRLINTAIFVFLTLCLFSGCSKSGAGGSSGGNNTNANLLVQSYALVIYDTALANTSTQYTITNNFDNQKRLTAVYQNGTSIYKGSSSDISDTFYFTYSSGQSLEVGDEHMFGQFLQATIHNYLSGPDNYPDSSVTSSTSGNIIEFIRSQSTYDANGYCTQIQTNSAIGNGPSVSSTETFTISGGNVTKMNMVDPSHNENYVENLLYGKTANNTTVSPSIPPYQGHANSNLVESTQSSSNGNPTSALDYSYSFDNQNRVSSITVTTPSGASFLKMYNIQYLQ